MAEPHGSYDAELETAVAAARAAGTAVRTLYDRSAAATYTKADGSFVTDADLAADRIIRDAIGRAFPDDAILTEEGVDDQGRLSAARCWIVDPIDGTNQLIARSGEFDILIALAVGGRPAVGVQCQPTTGTIVAAQIGADAWLDDGGGRHPLHLTPVPPGAPPRLLTSRWLGAPESLPTLGRVAARLGTAPAPVSSLGVNLRGFLPPDHPFDALIGLDFPNRVMDAWEWDCAAQDIIVRAAGGVVTDLWGQPHRYNKRRPRILGGILLSVDPATHARILDAIRRELPEPASPNA